MITRKAVDDIDHQASVVRERSLLLAEETLSNTYDFAHERARYAQIEPQAQCRDSAMRSSRKNGATAIRAASLARSSIRAWWSWRDGLSPSARRVVIRCRAFVWPFFDI
jgi:hypothetical protein